MVEPSLARASVKEAANCASGASSLIAVDGVTVATGTIGSGTATRTGIGVDGGTTKPWNGAVSLFGLYAGDFTADPAYADFLAWA